MAHASPDDVLVDLVAEFDRLETILEQLTPVQWASPSALEGWTVRDVVVHLAQTEALVSVEIEVATDKWVERERALDAHVDDQVRGDESSAAEVLARWKQARRDSVAALRAADPDVHVRWAAAPLKPKTLATTRLAEHWAHGLDICEPLGLALPDTDRLRHIAWLGHATLPYAMQLDGLEPVAVRCTLQGPGGDEWTLGPADATEWIRGSAGAFCRVGARRLPSTDSGLDVSSPHAADALRVLRNYAA